jgi:membrane dipeptidase
VGGNDPGVCARVIVDAHTDVLHFVGENFELVLRRGEGGAFQRYWLPTLRAGGVCVQICPLYGEGARRSRPRDVTLDQVGEFERLVEANAEHVCHVKTRADLDDARLRLVLALEGAEPLEGDPAAFDEWYERGVRSASLTWNHANHFAGGINAPTQGLTDSGRVLVRRLAELGVILDLAHASEQTWRDVLDEETPFSVTHAGCRAIRDHPRNLADWQLEALAKRGGVLGMMALSFVVDPDAPTLSRWLDHFDHAVTVMGIEHVGIGADFVDQDASNAKTQATPRSRVALNGFTGPERFPSLATGLRERGYVGERLSAILSGNWLRTLKAALPA